MGRGFLSLLVVLCVLVSPCGQGVGLGHGWPAANGQTHDFTVSMPETAPSRGAVAPCLSGIEGSFTENLGQLDPSIMYYCMGSPLSIALGVGWVAYNYRSAASNLGVMFHVRFDGSTGSAPLGVGELPYRSNYFIGNDPGAWRTGARSYREVLYESVWDGIDARFHLRDGSFKYEFVVAPGADPTRIRLGFESVERLSIDRGTGDLLVWTTAGILKDRAPVTYVEGSQGDNRVVSSYELTGDGSTVGFHIGEYDDSWPLVIDPELTYCTYLGGSKGDWYGRSEVDGSGNLYITGFTEGTFPVTQGSYDTTHEGVYDVFVCKMGNMGNSMTWATYIGGAGVDEGASISIDSSCDIYIAGETRSNDFPTTTGAYQGTYGGDITDCYVLKLNSTGDRLIYSTYLGGPEVDQLFGLDTDSQGSAYVTGRTMGDFPTTSGCFCSTFTPDEGNIFVSKLDDDGSDLSYSTYFPGYTGWTINVDDDGCAYVGGGTCVRSPTTASAYQSEYRGNEDCVVFKLNAQGTDLLKSTMIGGGGSDDIRNLALDEQGNLLMIGFTFNNVSSEDNDFPTTPNAYDSTYGKGGSDTIIVKLNASFERLDYSTYFGGRELDGDTLSFDLVVAKDGALLFTIMTESDDLETTETAYDQSYNGGGDVYVGWMDANGTALEYGSYFGGSGTDRPLGIHQEQEGTVITGYSTSVNLPTTSDAFQSAIGSLVDCFIAIMDTKVELPPDAKVPSAPLNVTAVPGDGAVALSWGPPSDLGNLTLKGYRLYRKGPHDAELAFETNLTRHTNAYTDLDVTNGQEYSYVLSAWNFLGEGARSPTVTALPLGVPSMPLSLKAAPGCGTVALSWNPPGRDGGTPVVGYRVLRGTVISDIPHLADLGNVTQYTDEGLENGRAYYYRVLAFNAVGDGRLSDPVMAAPVGPPEAPWDLKAVPGDSRVTLSWRAPVKDGGAQVLGYHVLRGYLESSLAELALRESYEKTYPDVDLDNGRVYYYAVVAFNRIGNSTRSAIVNATPIGIPGLPRDLTVEAGDGQVRLAWAPPDFDGGSAVLNYRIYRGTDELDLQMLLEVDAVSYTDSGLDNGRTYYYSVSAVNAVGEGVATEPRPATPLGLPEAPGNLAAEAGNGTVTLSWSDLVNTGGGTVTGFVLYRSEGDGPMGRLLALGAKPTTYTDAGLTAGTTYSYSISALTVVGEGLRSGIASAVPYGPPSPPRGLNATAGDGEVQLSWVPPDFDGASPLLGYVLLRGPSLADLKEAAQLGLVMVYRDTEVMNGQTYHYAVVAVNAAGRGELSGIVSATPSKPSTVPGKVRTLVGEAKGGDVTLLWSLPSEDGGTPITGYVVMRGESPGAMSVVAELGLVTTFKDIDLARGKTFYYSVAARNAVGQGEPFAAIEVKVPKKPSEGPGFDAAVVLAALAAISTATAHVQRRKAGAG